MTCDDYIVNVGSQHTTANGNPSGNYLTAQAPSIPSSDWYTQLSVQLMCAHDGTSAYWSGLMFGTPPTVTAASGCGSDTTAIGCRAGDSVNVTGTEFSDNADWLTVDVGGNSCDCSVASDSLLVCTLPAVAAADQNVSLPLTVSVTAAAFSTAASLDAAVTYAPALAIASVSGCGWVGNASFCYGGELLTLTGDWFGPNATVSAGNGSCGAVTVHSSSLLTCTLPGKLPTNTAIRLVVSSGGMLSNTDASLFVLPPVELHSVSFCASRTLPGCLFGDNITLSGLAFTNPLTITVGTTQVEAAWTQGGDNVTIALPAVGESSQGVWLDVRVQCGVSGANWTGGVLYRQYPQLSAVRASCRNGSSQCVSGDRIEVAGRHLNASSSLVSVLLASAASSSPHSCLDVTSSASSIFCVLPPIPPEEQGADLTLSVVIDGAESAGISGAVSYAALPAVSAISGCDQNGAANCHPGQVVTVDGWHLAQQDTSVTLSSVASAPSTYSCTLLHSATSSLRCQLPAHINATERGKSLFLFVTANGWTSAPVANLSVTADDLSLVSLAGCDQTTAQTAVSGCRAGSQLTLSGTAFTSPALLVLSGSAGNYTTAVAVQSLTSATVQLPALSSTFPSLVFSASLLCGVASNTLPAAVSYLMPSSSSSSLPSSSPSSTGADVADGGSWFGLSSDAAVVLGAALICGVLAILACIWHRGASSTWRDDETEQQRVAEPSDVERGRLGWPAEHSTERRTGHGERVQSARSREATRHHRERRADLRAPLVF